MLIAARAVIVTMLLFDFLLIIYGVYRLYRPSTRPVSPFLRLLIRLLTRIDPNDFLLPPQAKPLYESQQDLWCLGAGLCGLVLASVCTVCGQAAPIPTFPWSSIETTMLSHQIVVTGLGISGQIVGVSIGGGIGRAVGEARLSQATSAVAMSTDVRPRYANLVSPLLHMFLWSIPLANVLLVGVLFALIEQQPDMGLSRAVATLWPLAILPLLLILQALATELFGRQRYIPQELPSIETLSNSQRELIVEAITFQREIRLKEIYDPDMPNLLLYFQMPLTNTIAIPLAGPQIPAIALIIALCIVPLGLAMISRLMTDRLLPNTPLDALRAIQSTTPTAIPWRWHRPDVG